MSPPWIADQNHDFPSEAAVQKCDDAFRKRFFIEKICDAYDVHIRRLAFRQIGEYRIDHHLIECGIKLDRYNCIGIDVGGIYFRCARLCGCDADNSRAGAHIQYAATSHNFGFIEKITSQNQTSSPVMRPIR